MVKRIGSNRRKSSGLLTKSGRQKGKTSLSRYFAQFSDGDKVVLKADAGYVDKGLYFLRFHGKIGLIKGKKGNCYNVIIRDGNKMKTLVVHPVHLRKA